MKGQQTKTFKKQQKGKHLSIMDFPLHFSSGTIRVSTQDDPKAIYTKLRAEDVMEIKRYNSKAPLETLEASLNNSKICFSLFDTANQIRCMFGVAWTANPRIGLVWFLGDDFIYSNQIAFLTNSISFIEYFKNGHDVLFNHIDDSNLKSIKWLKWLGFQKTRSLQCGETSHPFSEYCYFTTPESHKIYVEKNWDSFKN